MKKLLSKIGMLKRLTAVGIYKTEELTTFYCLTVKRNGNNIVIEDAIRCTSTEEVHKIGNPVILLIDGKGVLTKRIELNDQQDVAWLRGLNFKSIYHTTFKQPKVQFISFCRTEIVEEEIAAFVKAGIDILDVFVGPLSISVLNAAQELPAEISSFDSILKYNGGHLESVMKIKNPEVPKYVVGTSEISGVFLPLYGSIVDYFANTGLFSRTVPSGIIGDDVLYKKGFKTLGISVLVFFFFLLLASYLGIWYLSGQNYSLTQENLYSNQSHQRVVEMERQREEQMAILQETGQLSDNYMSSYAYDIMRTTPLGIKLESVDIFPMASESKAEKKIILQPNVIEIFGQTANGPVFEKWIQTIKSFSWASKLEVISIKENQKGITKFELKIRVE